MKVYSSILAVQRELSAVGIAKGNFNKQQNYSFRGIDDFLQTLSPILSANGLMIVQTGIEQKSNVVTFAATGREMQMSEVTCQFTLFAEDGSNIVCYGAGKAMDSGDKALAKAISAAYKSFCIITFCIPVQGVPDSDADDDAATAATAATAASKGHSGTQVSSELVRQAELLIAKSGSKMEGVLAYLQVKSLQDASTFQLNDVINLLNRKVKNNG